MPGPQYRDPWAAREAWRKSPIFSNRAMFRREGGWWALGIEEDTVRDRDCEACSAPRAARTGYIPSLDSLPTSSTCRAVEGTQPTSEISTDTFPLPRSMFPGLGTAIVAFTAYVIYDDFIAAKPAHGSHGEHH
ncbi:hypothetical protein IAU60_004734 [Kwoniella sp. DSM 27419]